MIDDSHKEAIRALYQRVADSIPGFRKRYGQREMIGVIARAFGNAGSDDGSRFAVVEGRTGVGKTVGYLVPALVLGQALKKTVIVSTGTVALQEQLFSRDVPAVVSCMDTPVKFALLKGRGRFICPVRLDQMSGGAGQDTLFGDAAWDRRPEEAEIRWLRHAGQDFIDGKWDGEQDTLSAPPPGDVWQRIANNRHSCIGRRCDRYHGCPYFKSIDAVRAADLIVANHDLVLSCIAAESKLLPAPDEALFVFDEAHHLPGVAVSRFAYSVSTSARKWIERVPVAYGRLLSAIPSLPHVKRAGDLCKAISSSLGELDTALRHNKGLTERDSHRFQRGELDDQFAGLARGLASQADELLTALTDTHEILEASFKDDSTLAVAVKAAAVDAGFALARIEHFKMSIDLFAKSSTDEEPLAKWVSVERNAGYQLNASPIFAGPILRELLWGNASGAILTSATLTTLGDFGFYLRDVGLDSLESVAAVAVQSPFDYEAQGEILVPRMKTDPGKADEHTIEVCELLPAHLEEVRAGALVLFASRKQMQAIYDSLPASIKDDVLMQGSQSRAQLIAAHVERVRAGQRSILLGMQTFGEGLDLPGSLCEHVFIAKLPFSPPDSPIEEARSEWIEARGGNPFMEVTLPKAGLTLIQWAGRLIRTETDSGRVVLFDRRIKTKRYGAQLLSGLPPFRRVIG